MADPFDKPLLVSGPRARKLLGIGNTKYWRLVKGGLIETVQVGGRRMATYTSIEAVARPSGQYASEVLAAPERYGRHDAAVNLGTARRR